MSEPLTEFEKMKLHRLISTQLVDIESLFKPGVMQITFLARNKNNPKGHVLITTEDNVGNAVKAIQELMDQTDASVFPAIL